MIESLTQVMGEEELHQAAEASTECPLPPTAVPGYKPERLLGKGAFGEVWLALNENTGVKVAIKFYAHQGGLDLPLLMREVEKLRLLATDRYVVQLLEVGWKADPPFYVMEHFERGSLEDLLRNGTLAVTEAVTLFREIVEGMAHAHDKGILHCDLKPANILLDVDCKPRLADFGQARLSEEHVQALGTLFYMPPEQTRPNAEPDVRWDVYALGVILYRMLTGQLPYHSKETASYVQQAEGRELRLRRYRRTIRKSPFPAAHRKVPGLDSALKNIIDRCLAVDANKRFPNVRSILDALNKRALNTARRPLLLLGVLGPILLTLLFLVLAWKAYAGAVQDVNGAMTDYALESNRSTARLAAESVARRLQQRWTILEREATDKKLRERIRSATLQGGPEARQPLDEHLDALAEKYKHTATSSSWFVTDAQGFLLSVGPPEKRALTRKTGAMSKGYSWRNFFHGQDDEDFPENDPRRQNVRPIERAHRSIVFESNSEGKPRIIVFSVPVQSDLPEDKDKTIGVLAMAVQLGEFVEIHSGHSQGADKVNEAVVLVETRRDWRRGEGLILQHPELERRLQTKKEIPEVRLPPEQLAELKRLVSASQGAPLSFSKDYRDPFRDHSPMYDDRWLVVAEPVHFKKRDVIRGVERDAISDIQTGWVVLVQERYAAVVQPVDQLRARLSGIVRLGMGAALAVVALLWGFAAILQNPSLRPRLYAYLKRRAGLPSETVSGASASLASRSASGVSGGASSRTRSTAARPLLSGSGDLVRGGSSRNEHR